MVREATHPVGDWTEPGRTVDRAEIATCDGTRRHRIADADPQERLALAAAEVRAWSGWRQCDARSAVTEQYVARVCWVPEAGDASAIIRRAVLLLDEGNETPLGRAARRGEECRASSGVKRAGCRPSFRSGIAIGSS